MKTTQSISQIVGRTVSILAIFTVVNFTLAGTAGRLVDDFSDPQSNSLGVERMYIDDTTVGGKTSAQQIIADGVFAAKGEIAPPRGQPGWASTVLLLDTQGSPVDVSVFEGIRLLVRVNKGNLSISANSQDVTNFDYHSAAITRDSDGEFHEVKIPFASMKRAWSEQTPLNTKAILSLSLVAFDIQKAAFDFEVDEIAFY